MTSHYVPFDANVWYPLKISTPRVKFTSCNFKVKFLFQWLLRKGLFASYSFEVKFALSSFTHSSKSSLA